jgi:uncharacterized membrane protein
MDKNYKIPLILFLIGMVITILGALFKIMHWPGASIILIIGMFTEMSALIVLIARLLKN